MNIYYIDTLGTLDTYTVRYIHVALVNIKDHLTM